VGRRLWILSGILAGMHAAVIGQHEPADYPGWRGQLGDGSASAFREPASWPDSPTLRWRVDVGEGYATPVVMGGTPREAVKTAVVKAGDLLFLLNDDGEMIVARPTPIALGPFRRYVVARSATWAQPAISANRIFIKDTSSLALWTID